jgi:anti-sigma factor RsiW
MAKLARLSPEQRENLTAYLDGELDEAATQEIEQVLAVSEVARHEVDMLARSWDMLNVLPAHKASGEFTRKTMTNLRAAEQPGSGAVGDMVSRNARRGAVLTFWVAILAACGYASFVATNRWVPNEAEQLLQAYPIAEHLDKYSQVGSIEFLRELQAKHTFAEHDDHANK